MSEQGYDGDPLDGTVQYVTERPELEKGADGIHLDGSTDGWDGATVVEPNSSAGPHPARTLTSL